MSYNIEDFMTDEEKEARAVLNARMNYLTELKEIRRQERLLWDAHYEKMDLQLQA